MPHIRTAASRRPHKRSHRAAAALALGLFLAGATPTMRRDEIAERRAGLLALRAEDARVADVAWRLASANVALCIDRTWLSGIVFYDAAQFSREYRVSADQAFGISRGTVVAVVVPRSAAARAGLRPGDVVSSIGGQLVRAEAGAAKASFAGVARAVAAIDRALADGPAMLRVRRGDAEFEVEIERDLGCASFVQIIPSTRRNAGADGQTVTITTATAAFARTPDELAAIVAHEMAHNILRHRKRLDAEGVSKGLFAGLGRNGARLRAAEHEADRLSIHLMQRAGYAPQAALVFWERFGRAAEPLIGDGTHAGWRTRVATMAREVGAIVATPQQSTDDRPKGFIFPRE